MGRRIYASCYEPPGGLGLNELRETLAMVVRDAEETRGDRTLAQRLDDYTVTARVRHGWPWQPTPIFEMRVDDHRPTRRLPLRGMPEREQHDPGPLRLQLAMSLWPWKRHA